MTTTTQPAQSSAGTAASPHGRGFWLIAATFMTLMAFTTVPTPIYRYYQERDGFPTFVITLIFAAYGIGVMVGLYFAGHLSDVHGRRRMLAVAIGLTIVSAAIFLISQDTAALLIARLISGLAIGVLTPTATAALGELAAAHRPDRSPAFASTVATVVNTGGLALGPLIGGLLVTLLPDPMVTPYAVFLALAVLTTVALWATPETVNRVQPQERPAYRPQKVALLPEGRAPFRAAALAAGAAFSVLGFFTSLTGTFVGRVLGYGAPLVTGSIVFGVLGASALVQVLLSGLHQRARLITGVWSIVAGLVLVAVAALVRNLPLFVIAGLVAGAGVGLIFQASVATAVRFSQPESRGGTLAGLFLAAYVGITLPVIAVGVVATWWSIPTVLMVFAALVAATILACAPVMLHSAARA